MVILSMFYFLLACHPDHPDFEPSYKGVPPEENLDQYLDTSAVFKGLDEVKGVRKQLDSLLTLTDKLKNYDDEVALMYADTAYSIATDKNWQLSRGIASYYIALLKGRREKYGEGIEDALVDANISREIFVKLKAQKWTTRANNLIGIFYHRKNKIDQALDYLNQAMHIVEAGGLSNADSLMLKGELLHDFANVYRSKKDSALADSLFNQSYQYYAITNNKTSTAFLEFDWAQLNYEKEDHKKAEELILNGLKYAFEYNDNRAKFTGYQRLGLLRSRQYRKYGDEIFFAEAMDNFLKCFEFQKEDLYFLHNQMARIYQQKAYQATDPNLAYSFVDSAIVAYRDAMVEARKEGVLGEMMKMGERVSELCKYRSDKTGKDCNELLDTDAIHFFNENYAGMTDTIGNILQIANRRNKAFEIKELNAKNKQRSNIQWIISGAGLLLAGFVFIVLLLIQQQKRLKAKMEALRAQINPHFISNSLNAIESLVNLDKKEAAAKYLIHFSRLSRRILNSSREGSASLAEELETLKHFLALEQLRFRDKLQYEIHIDEDIDPEQVEIPAMILQPYAENAIWHGIKPKMEKGLLKIEARREGKFIQIIIEDDGVGRAKSAAMKAASVLQQTSVGMKINQERLNVMGRAKGAKVEIIDLFDENGQANGTRVVLRLPYKQMTKK